jgi:Tetratricopeptide repeat
VTDPARRLADVSSTWAGCSTPPGCTCRRAGESRAARALFEDAHELYRRRLGPDHLDTVAAARTLADDLDALGRQEHARRVRQAAEVGSPRDPEADRGPAAGRDTGT